MSAIWEYARNLLYRPDENIVPARRRELSSAGCEMTPRRRTLRTTRDLR